MRKFYLSLVYISVCLLFAVSCSKTPEEVVFKGSAVSIEYHRDLNIVEGDWIQIDQVRFVHVDSKEKLKQPTDSLITLPTSRFKELEVEGKKLIERYTRIRLGILLAKGLLATGNSTSTYRVGSIPELNLIGKVNLTKRDSGLIQIRTSKNYPVTIVVK